MKRWIIPLSAMATIAFGGETARAAAPAEGLFQWRPFLAPFHSVVLHLPIGFITAAFLLELYRFFKPSEEVRRITAWALIMSFVTGVITAVFGWMRGGTGDYEPALLQKHTIYGIAVPVALLATIALQWVAYREGGRKLSRNLYFASLLATVGLVTVAGHYGGDLTHGSKYLTEYAPNFVKKLLEEESAQAVVTEKKRQDENARFFEEKVQPILASKCIACHGAEKQKGHYRMDKAEAALKAGESGKTPIKPGDPLGSYVVQLILLPPDHDDLMPPVGKKQLKPEETIVLIEWIRNGAKYPEKISTTKGT